MENLVTPTRLETAFRGRSVLITGHTGFKGSWLAEWLLLLGARVTGIALPAAPHATLFSQLQLAPRLDHLTGDLREPEPVRQAAETADLTEAQVSRLELAVEEALVNLCNHAYADQTQPGPVYCRITAQADGLLVEIADQGPPFDPLTRPDPDTTLELEEREPGGLGVFLIKTLVSEVGYRREEGRNILTLRMLKTSG